MDYLQQMLAQMFGPHQLDSMQPQAPQQDQQRLVDYIRQRFSQSPMTNQLNPATQHAVDAKLPQPSGGRVLPPGYLGVAPPNQTPTPAGTPVGSKTLYQHLMGMLS